jgi:hypothetical protein
MKRLLARAPIESVRYILFPLGMLKLRVAPVRATASAPPETEASRRRRRSHSGR